MTVTIVLVSIIVVALVSAGWLILRSEQGNFGHRLNRAKDDFVIREQDEQRAMKQQVIQYGLSGMSFEHPQLAELRQHMHEHIVGMDGFVNGLIVTLLAQGHLLVEGVPGLAKTKTMHVFSQLLGVDTKRIQFTPDMLPSDIVGVEMYHATTGEFDVKMGPVVTNLLLADEINRATPKVQSALLESMQERQVTLAGQSFPLPRPFMVMATQNPLEQEGTYPLPEAQVDRFLAKMILEYPSHEQEKQVLQMHYHGEEHAKIKHILTEKKILTMCQEVQSVTVSETIMSYITAIVHATRQPHDAVVYGSSPRGSLGLMRAAQAVAYIQSRDYVTHEDVMAVALMVLRHRIVLTYEAKINGITSDGIIMQILQAVAM